MMYWGDFGAWWMLIGMVFMVLFWGGVIWLVVWAVRKMTGHGAASGNKTPLDIAKERYARGEINREQYEQMKKDL